MSASLTPIKETTKLVCSTQIVDQHFIQPQVHDMLHAVANDLPDNMRLVIFESYRPKSRQVMLWNRTMGKVRSLNPGASEEEIVRLTEIWTANPYTNGSGHQAGAAVDVSIEADGILLDMGTAMHEFNELTSMHTVDGLTDTQKGNRRLLKTSMEATGMINYPDEWWHYSYGDRLWAEVSGRTPDTIVFRPLMDD